MPYKFVKLTDTWNTLTPSQKVDLFNDTGSFTATANELERLGIFKALSLSTSTTSIAQSVDVKAILNDTLILPNKLFGSTFLNITNIDILDSGVIKYIFTKDLENYYTYYSGSWHLISDMSVSNIMSVGMTSEDVVSITANKWNNFYNAEVDIDGIGIGFVISETDITDKPYIDNLAATVTIRGSWMKAEHMVDYEYGYPSNTVFNAGGIYDDFARRNRRCAY